MQKICDSKICVHMHKICSQKYASNMHKYANQKYASKMQVYANINMHTSLFTQPAPQGRPSRFSSHREGVCLPHPISGGGLVYSLIWY